MKSRNNLFTINGKKGKLKIKQGIEWVELATVTHGKWHWKDGKCYCSACTEVCDPKHHYEDGTVEEYAYCPNCGATMDLE